MFPLSNCPMDDQYLLVCLDASEGEVQLTKGGAMIVHVTYFDLKEGELKIAISFNGVTAIPLRFTFPEFHQLVHRLREIEEGFLPENKSSERR